MYSKLLRHRLAAPGGQVVAAQHLHGAHSWAHDTLERHVWKVKFESSTTKAASL